MGKKYRHNKDNIVTLSVQELENLVYTASYQAARKTEQQLFAGLLGFFNRLFDENEFIFETLDYIKVCLQQVEKEPETSQKNNEDKKKGASSFANPDSKLGNFIANMTDEQKAEFEKKLKETMKQARLINQPQITVPVGFKQDD